MNGTKIYEHKRSAGKEQTRRTNEQESIMSRPNELKGKGAE